VAVRKLQAREVPAKMRELAAAVVVKRTGLGGLDSGDWTRGTGLGECQKNQAYKKSPLRELTGKPRQVDPCSNSPTRRGEPIDPV
jgi:hypothetical protein